MRVTLLYFDGCPNWRDVDEKLQVLSAELGFELERRRVDTPEEAESLGFRGSPTVSVDGRDPFARGDEPAGMACRLYPKPDGLRPAPSLEQLREALQW